MPKVHLPDGRVVNFPDSMSADAIQGAMRRLTAQPTPATTPVAPQAAPPVQAQRPPMPAAGRGTAIDLARSYDAARGAGAGAASTIYHGGDLLRQGWNAVAPQSMETERVINQPAVQAAMTPPSSGAGRAGFAAEQAAEFLIPSTRIARAMRGAPVARAMAAEGGAAAALSAAQGGDPVTAGAFGAAGPVLSRGTAQIPGVQRAAGALRESAEQRVAQALGATKERFKAMSAKLAPDMLDRGVPGPMGASRSGLLEQARTKASGFGKAIDVALKGAANEPVSTGLILDALNEAKTGFQTTRRMSVADAARQGLAEQARDAGGGMVDVVITIDPRPVQQLDELQRTIAQLGESATVEQIVAVRRVWDDVVSRAGGFQHRSGGAFGVPLAEQTEAWAKREATKSIRKVLAEAQPDLAALNKEYAFWSGLRDVLTVTEKRTQAQQGGLTRTILGGAGATVGAMTGDNASDRMQNAVLGGLAGRQVMQVVTSPRWRFVSANVRKVLADALMSENPRYVSAALARATAAIGGGGALRPVPSH